MNDYNELYHHGILGMRWGIRRTPEELGHDILKNDAKQAEVAAKIAKMERAHELNPKRGYRKSEARLYKQADKLKREREDLEMDKAVAEKWEAAAKAKREYEESKKAQKEAKQLEKATNSHDLQNKPLSQMSDKELADYLTRKANEQRYLQLNPPKKTAASQFKEFASKNMGKAGQAFVEAGIEVGKEALKKELQKQLNNQPSPNTNKKYAGRDLASMTDKEIKEYNNRLSLESGISTFMKNINGNSGSSGNSGNSGNGKNTKSVDAVNKIIDKAYDVRFISDAGNPYRLNGNYNPKNYDKISSPEDLSKYMAILNGMSVL